MISPPHQQLQPYGDAHMINCDMADVQGRVLASGAQRKRKYAPRSKSGCLPCRSRRKRCSGESPECDACVRLNIRCLYESKRDLSDLGKEEVRREEVDLAEGQEQVANLSLSPRSSLFSSSTTSTATRIQVPGLGPPRYSPPMNMDATIQRQPSSPMSLLPEPGKFNHVDPKILMSYYIHSFVPKISCVNVAGNAFTSVYVPMAFQCKAVLDAIIASAASHLAKTSADDEHKVMLLEVSATCQKRCHTFLKDRISLSGEVVRDTLEAVTIILLLVGLEVQNGARTHRWVDKLDCIRKIVRQYGGRAKFCRSSWEAGCLYQHFLYHDVMGLIMSGVSVKKIQQDETQQSQAAESPAIPLDLTAMSLPWAKYVSNSSAHASPTDLASSSYTDLPNTLHPLLGLSTNLFFVIQKIFHSQLQPSLDNFSQTPSEREDLFLSLEQDIISLKFELYPSSPSEMALSHIDISTRLDLVTLAETYRLTALILLYRLSARNTTQLEAIAERIISLARRISSGSAAEAGLTCPLFLAGAEISAEENIIACATKLMSIRDRVQVLNIQSVETVLEEVWRGKLNSDGSKDWENVLRDWEWVINLG